VASCGPSQADLSARLGAIREGEAEVAVLRAVDVAVGLAGIQSYVLEGALAELEARTAAVLETLSGGSLGLHLAATKVGRTTKREQVRQRGQAGAGDSRRGSGRRGHSRSWRQEDDWRRSMRETVSVNQKFSLLLHQGRIIQNGHFLGLSCRAIGTEGEYETFCLPHRCLHFPNSTACSW
jgi:hypothetical protein